MAYYFIVNATVTDRDKFDEYQRAVRPTLAGQDVKVLVSTFDAETVEGTSCGPRAVIIEAPTREAFMAWYESDAYQGVIGLRLAASEGFAILAKGL